MARIVTPLTNTQVKQAKDKLYKLADGDGLQLRVKTTVTDNLVF